MSGVRCLSKAQGQARQMMHTTLQMCSVVLGGVPVITPPKVNTLNTLYIMLYKVNAYWLPDNYDEDEYETLGQKAVVIKGEMIINTSHVVAFHPHTENGHCMIRLLSGDVFEIEESYKSFTEVMFSEEVSRDILASKCN